MNTKGNIPDLQLKEKEKMKCSKCPLYSYWNNENDRGESCGLFGDAWDSRFQYEDKEGTIVGCYIDRHYIEKADKEYLSNLEVMEDSTNLMESFGNDIKNSAIDDLESISELFY